MGAWLIVRFVSWDLIVTIKDRVGGERRDRRCEDRECGNKGAASEI